MQVSDNFRVKDMFGAIIFNSPNLQRGKELVGV